MAGSKGSSNKAKIARRVVEVLEYFDDNHREATVMDIVRRYNRPQSSTSELLSSLVELGLLYKDPYSRSYSLAPRAALLGVASQSGIVRDGGLVRLIDRLVAQTGLAVAVYGMVGLNAQIVSWRAASRGSSASTRGLFGGLQDPLYTSAAGWLLLSTIAQPRAEGVVRRLNAEAPEDRKFSTAMLNQRVQQCRDSGYALGPAGFDTTAETLAVLLPDQGNGHRLAVGFAFGPEARVQPEALLECLRDAVRTCIEPEAADSAPVEVLHPAAA
ncbi:MAG: helix-turn-helix domain-containing protein [Sphingomonadales bacterium]|nr:helix-turn-helix domain-containing protein [Sphingomonadales bacterium]